MYKPKPEICLFKANKQEPVIRHPQYNIFTSAKEKAGMLKIVSIYSLRNSFATHLLEKGTGIKYIKELSGHFNIKTTERYLPASNGQLVKMISPFDDMAGKENIE